MVRQHGNSRSRWLIRTAFVALAALAAANAALVSARAADLADQAHSLRKVPADAAFYTSSLRLKEQWDIFKASKAYAKLMEIPFVQIAKMQISYQWQQQQAPPVAKFRDYMQSDAGQDAIAVLKEMFSDEVFVYGGNDVAEAFKVVMELNSLNRTAAMEASAKGEERGQVMFERAMEILDKHSETLRVPTMVFGFRIKDKERAKRELGEVHSLLRNLLDEEQPDLASHLQKDDIGGHEFLTLRLDGTMIPWDQAREEAKDLDDEQFEKLKTFISKHKLVVALGVTDEFVLLSIGESSDHLEKLGKGAVIADQPSIKRLEKHAGERLASIEFVSKAFMESVGSAQKTIEDMAAAADVGLMQAKVSEEHRKLIVDDIRKLDLARYMPQPGDKAGATFLTGRGYECYSYSDSTQPMMDSSKPLGILNHVGGNPMVMVASRSKQNIKDYEDGVAWLKETVKHVEAVAEEKSKPEDWEKYQEVRKRAVMLFERLDQANREHLYPALADGQGAFVLDFTAKSKQWVNKMPKSPKDLPMLELAFIAGVSDAERLRQAVSAYIDAGVEAYKIVREIHPDDVPELKLPTAKVSEISGGGKLYSYPLPKKWGIDSQVAVNAGLTDKFVAVSTMPKTTERLLQEMTPEFDTSIKLDRPAAMVSHVEIAKLIDSIRPWIDYGIDVATGKLKPPKDDSDDEAGEDKPEEPNPATMQLGFIVPQIHQLLDVGTALRSVTSVTYEEGGVWVTHTETHIRDLK
jgi:hypothetical protein